jgi:hypothetical protein
MKTNISLSIAAAIVALGTGFDAIGGGALASTVQGPALTLAKATCTDVMKVRTDAEAAGCVSTLLDALGAKAQGEVYAANDVNCMRRGLADGTADFSACVLDLNRAGANASSSDRALYGGALETVVVESRKAADIDDRFPGTFAARHRREEDSCARLGLDPGSTPFAYCVSGLDTAIYTADTPQS